MKFSSYIGVDWSGAENERGRVAVARQRHAEKVPQLVRGPSSWTRRGAVEWMIDQLAPGSEPIFIGLDFCFGYPAGAAKKVFGAATWADLPSAIRELLRVNGTARSAALSINEKFGDSGPFRMAHADRKFDFYLREEILRYRLTELFAPGALSAWDAIKGPQVALSTLTGIAALADLIDARAQGKAAFKVFPFESISPGDSVLAEVYPGLAPRYDYDKGDEGDASRITRWVRELATESRLLSIPSPKRSFGENWNEMIREEGWIAGLAL